MKMTIEDMPERKIAYIRRTGPYGSGNIETMEKLKSIVKSEGLFTDETVIFGIARDNPEIVSPECCRYDACLLIQDSFAINEKLNIGELQGGRYAVFEIEHTAQALENAWLEIFPCITIGHFIFDETRPIYEMYSAKLLKEHLCEICVPLK